MIREMNWKKDESCFEFLEEIFDHFRDGIVEFGAKSTISKEPAPFEETFQLDMFLAIARDLDDSEDNVFVDLAAAVEVKQVCNTQPCSEGLP